MEAIQTDGGCQQLLLVSDLWGDAYPGGQEQTPHRTLAIAAHEMVRRN